MGNFMLYFTNNNCYLLLDILLLCCSCEANCLLPTYKQKLIPLSDERKDSSSALPRHSEQKFKFQKQVTFLLGAIHRNQLNVHEIHVGVGTGSSMGRTQWVMAGVYLAFGRNPVTFHCSLGQLINGVAIMVSPEGQEHIFFTSPASKDIYTSLKRLCREWWTWWWQKAGGKDKWGCNTDVPQEILRNLSKPAFRPGPCTAKRKRVSECLEQLDLPTIEMEKYLLSITFQILGILQKGALWHAKTPSITQYEISFELEVLSASRKDFFSGLVTQAHGNLMCRHCSR